MNWDSIDGDTAGVGYGERWTYLVTADLSADGREVTAVRLSRYRAWPGPVASRTALEAARNVIVFPMGRGPGRPAGVPEIAALMETAKGYAERFEAGEDLEGHPAWRHAKADPWPAAIVGRGAADPRG